MIFIRKIAFLVILFPILGCDQKGGAAQQVANNRFEQQVIPIFEEACGENIDTIIGMDHEEVYPIDYLVSIDEHHAGADRCLCFDSLFYLCIGYATRQCLMQFEKKGSTLVLTDMIRDNAMLYVKKNARIVLLSSVYLGETRDSVKVTILDYTGKMVREKFVDECIFHYWGDFTAPESIEFFTQLEPRLDTIDEIMKAQCR